MEVVTDAPGLPKNLSSMAVVSKFHHTCGETNIIVEIVGSLRKRLFTEVWMGPAGWCKGPGEAGEGAVTGNWGETWSWRRGLVEGSHSQPTACRSCW